MKSTVNVYKQKYRIKVIRCLI